MFLSPSCSPLFERHQKYLTESHIIALSMFIQVVCIFVIAARNVRGHSVIGTGFSAGFYFYIVGGSV